MPRKKKAKSPIPKRDAPFVEFDAAYLVKRLALCKGVLYHKAVRADCMSYHLVVTADGKATVSATNLLERLRLDVPVLRSEGGGGTVHINVIALDALLGSYAEPRIRVYLDDPEAVKAGYTQTLAVLPGYKPEAIQATAESSITSTGWVVRGDRLATALQAVARSRDTESTRYALGGVALVFPEAPEGDLTLVSTDGRRISRYHIPVKAHPPGTVPDRVVPRRGPDTGLPLLSQKGLGVAQKLAREAGEASVALCVVPGKPTNLEGTTTTPTRIQVVTRDAVLTAEVPEGRFPRYQDIFPTAEPTAVVTLPDASRLGTLVQSALAATDTEHVSLELVAAGGAIMISAGGDLKGKVQLSLGDVAMTGRFTVRVGAAYLRDVFAVAADDPLEIKFFGPNTPLVFECGAWFDQVLMPITEDEPPPPRDEPEEDDEPGDGDEPEPTPAPKKPRRGRKPGPEPEPVPLAVTPDAHVGNGEVKPPPRRRRRSS